MKTVRNRHAKLKNFPCWCVKKRKYSSRIGDIRGKNTLEKVGFEKDLKGESVCVCFN